MTNTNRRFKDEIFEQFARIGKAVASAKRIELLDLLSQGERHVEPLAEAANISVANASQHLQILRPPDGGNRENGSVFTYRCGSVVGSVCSPVGMLAENAAAGLEQTPRSFVQGRIGLTGNRKECSCAFARGSDRLGRSPGRGVPRGSSAARALRATGELGGDHGGLTQGS